MKVTIEQILDFNGSVEEFLEKPLNIKTAYKLAMIKRQTDEQTDFYQTSFFKILNEYGKKDENGELQRVQEGVNEGNVLIQEDKLEECNNALSDLMGLEVEINNYNLKLEDFGDMEVSADDLATIIPFLSEGEQNLNK